jgi:hypothetical protein
MVAWSHAHGQDILAARVCDKGYSLFIRQEAQKGDSGRCQRKRYPQRTCSPVTYFLTSPTSYLSRLPNNANIWWVHQALICFWWEPSRSDHLWECQFWKHHRTHYQESASLICYVFLNPIKLTRSTITSSPLVNFTFNHFKLSSCDKKAKRGREKE